MATEATISRTSGSLTPLCWLAGKYGTDKLGFYTPIYDLLLSGRRDSVRRVLEVGIGTPEAMKHVPGYKAGASLRMWRDYFWNADICGLDINQNSCAEATEPYNRIFTFCADSRDLSEILPVLAAGGRFDLIVDDGNHDAKVQIETLHNLSRLLVPGGLYIIEDAECKSCLPEHMYIQNVTDEGTAKAIVIRQEAIHAV